MVISNLKIACTDLRLLLDFQLNKKFTIKTAIDAVSKINTQYHHDVLHLRYSYHTISMCAKVHNFISNQKNEKGCMNTTRNGKNGLFSPS